MNKLTTWVIFATALLACCTAASAASGYCKEVAAKPIEQLTQDDFNKCKGPILAAVMCKGWRAGKAESGCPDHKTAAEWTKSSDSALRAKGQNCLVSVSLDMQCGIN